MGTLWGGGSGSGVDQGWIWSVLAISSTLSVPGLFYTLARSCGCWTEVINPQLPWDQSHLTVTTIL